VEGRESIAAIPANLYLDHPLIVLSSSPHPHPQRTLDQQAKLADSLAQENEAITRRYNEQVHARAWPHRPLG
jgi:hypothetical protein